MIKKFPQACLTTRVNAIYEDKEKNLWVGTVEGGLNLKRQGTEQFLHYRWERGEISHNSVSSLASDNQGRLWVGTWGGGINIMNPKALNRPLQVIYTHPETGFPLFFIAVLVYDPINNGMWVGANQGALFFTIWQLRNSFPLC